MLFAELKNPVIDFVVFNNKIEKTGFKGDTLDSTIQGIKKISADGGTLFAPVIDKYVEIIGKSEERDICILFLSDGQGENFDKLKPQLESFKKFI